MTGEQQTYRGEHGLTVSLTTRQAQIIEYVLAGWEDRTIARDLGLSYSYIKNTVWDLLRAFGVPNRTRLTALIVQQRERAHLPHLARALALRMRAPERRKRQERWERAKWAHRQRWAALQARHRLERAS